MAQHALVAFRAFAWHLPSPPAAATSLLPFPKEGVSQLLDAPASALLEKYRLEAMDAWSTSNTPLVRYAGALLNLIKTPFTRSHYASTLHALAARYEQLADASDAGSEQHVLYTTEYARCVRLATLARLEAAQPLWSSELPVLVDVYVKALKALPEAVTLSGWALGVAQCYRTCCTSDDVEVALYAHVADAFWRATALIMAAPLSLSAVPEYKNTTTTYKIEYMTNRARHWAAAEMLWIEAQQRVKKQGAGSPAYSSLLKAVEGALAKTRIDLENLMNERDAFAHAHGDYTRRPLDTTSLTNLELPSALDIPSLTMGATSSWELLDGLLVAQADAFAATLRAPRAVPVNDPAALFEKEQRSVNSVMADLAAMSEEQLLQTELVHTLRERRALALGVLIERLRAYANGLLGVRRKETIAQLENAIRELQASAMNA